MFEITHITVILGTTIAHLVELVAWVQAHCEALFNSDLVSIQIVIVTL